MRIDIDVHFLLRYRGKRGARVLVLHVVLVSTKSLPSGPKISTSAATSTFLTARTMASAACCARGKVFCCGCEGIAVAAFVCGAARSAVSRMEHAAIPSIVERIFRRESIHIVDFMYFSSFMACSPPTSAATATRTCASTAAGRTHAGCTPRAAGLGAGFAGRSAEGARIRRSVVTRNLAVANVVSASAAAVRARIARLGARRRSTGSICSAAASVIALACCLLLLLVAGAHSPAAWTWNLRERCRRTCSRLPCSSRERRRGAADCAARCCSIAIPR